MHFTLPKIIDPIIEEDFFNNYFEKKSLVIKRSNPDFYNDLLSINRINDYFNESEVIYPSVYLVKDGSPIIPNEYVVKLNSSSHDTEQLFVDKDKLFSNFYNGSTIILLGHERRDENLRALIHNFQKEFICKVQANIYLTPSNARGFKPHFDSHDVFILQIGGHKEWLIYDSPIELPIQKHKLQSDWKPGEPSLSVVLEQGDLLYIPRGFVHEAKTSNEISLHITLGMEFFTYGDLLNYVVSNIEEDVFYRHSIPIKEIKTKLTNTEEFISRTINNINGIDINSVLETRNYEFTSMQMSDFTNKLKEYVNINKVDMLTIFKIRDYQFYNIFKNEKEIEIRYNNKIAKFPIEAKNTIELLVSKTKFRPIELAGNLNDNISICKQLLEVGFLTTTID